MRHFILFCFNVCLFSTLLFAGEAKPVKEGILTPEIVAEIQSSFNLDLYTRATLNALNRNDIKELAKNQEIWNSLDFIFSHELDIKGITDQKSSGRCWLFATFNVLRQKVIKKYNLKDFEFSENYAMFWDKMEKANLFLEYIIQNSNQDYNDRELVLLLKTPLPDGGFWHMSANVITKYGAIPKEAMPETHNSSSTDRMNNLMEMKMRIDAFELKSLSAKGKSAKELRQRKVDMLKDIYRMLVLNLGQPPTSFEWRYTDKDGKMGEVKTYNPLSFYQEAVGVKLDDYAVFGNCPTQPYGKNYSIKLGRGQLEGMDWTFLNMDMKVLNDLTYKVLLDTIPVQLSVDMGQQVDGKSGLMALDLFDFEALYRVDFQFDKSGWILTRESAPNHAMVIVGMDTLNGKARKWKIENSWGSDRGDGGFFMMTAEWFDYFGYSIVVEKKYLPPEMLKLLETKPIELPFWDPLARCISVGGYE